MDMIKENRNNLFPKVVEEIKNNGQFLLAKDESAVQDCDTDWPLCAKYTEYHHEISDYFVYKTLNKPNIIYSCGEDRELLCFDLKLNKRLNTQSIPNGYLCGIAQKLDKDNEIISVGVNCNLAVWDFYKTEPVQEIILNEKMMAIKISHSGKYFALGSSSGELWLFKLPECEFISKSQGHSRQINNLNWSPDDKQIVSISIDSSICIWNVYI